MTLSKILICKTPLRISFLGGGTDFPKWYNENMGMVISTSINKYCYVMLRDLPPYNYFKHRFRYYNEERVNSFGDIKHPVIKNILQKKKVDPSIGKELVYFGDVPALSGLGTSSAFTVSLLNLVSCIKKKKISKKKLANEAMFFEQKVLKENIGSQDQIACTYGGFNQITFKKKRFNIQSIKCPGNQISDLEKSILLVHTGISRHANDIEKEKINNIKNKYNELKEIYNLCLEASKQIKTTKKLKYLLSDYINESWIIKKKLSARVSNESLDNLYDLGIKNGALAGKILGAGSGGFMLFIFKDQDEMKAFQKKIPKNISFKIKFDQIGSEIILNYN